MTPSIAVGIPTLNDAQRLRFCLESLVKARATLPYRLLVCDDGSRSEELERNKKVIHESVELREQNGLEMLMNQGRLGIPTTWNRLVRHAYADVHVLLNDDVQVTDDWLDVLVHSVWQNPWVGMVGLKSFRDWMGPEVPDFREATLSDGGGTLLASTGYAFAFRRELFDLVGGFDERYFCFYEEVDFGVSLRERGYGSYIASHPIIRHEVGATLGDRRNLDAVARLEESRLKFREKWGAPPVELRNRWPRPPIPRHLWNSSLATLVE